MYVMVFCYLCGILILLYIHYVLNSIALFYYTLGNLSPKYRSSLRSIQLLIAVKSNLLVKYGADKILEPVLEEIKQLESVSFIRAEHIEVYI